MRLDPSVPPAALAVRPLSENSHRAPDTTIRRRHSPVRPLRRPERRPSRKTKRTAPFRNFSPAFVPKHSRHRQVRSQFPVPAPAGTIRISPIHPTKSQKESRPENRPRPRMRGLRIALLSPPVPNAPPRRSDRRTCSMSRQNILHRPLLRKPDAICKNKKPRRAEFPHGRIRRIGKKHRPGESRKRLATDRPIPKPRSDSSDEAHDNHAYIRERPVPTKKNGNGRKAIPVSRNPNIRNYYNFGPAATSALPASLPVNLAKFLMKRSARSLALASHCAASA